MFGLASPKSSGENRSTSFFGNQLESTFFQATNFIADFRGFKLMEMNVATAVFQVDNWLVVSTHLKNINQNGNLPQVGVKMFETYLEGASFGRSILNHL